MGSSLPDQGIEPAPPALEDKQLITGLPGKSQETGLNLRAFSSGCEEKKKKSKNVQNCELAECEERPARKQSFLDTSGDQGATAGERPTMPHVHREPPGALIHGFLAIGVLLLWETMV